MKPNRVRIAVTGLGLVTPAGLNRESTWKNIQAGTATARWISVEELGYPELKTSQTWYGCRVSLPFETSVRLEDFALRAAREAVDHADLTPTELGAAGVVIGTSKSDLHAIDLAWKDSNDFVSRLLPSGPACVVAEEFGCRAGALCPVAACATGLVSIINAANLIREGVCKVALAGSADASLHPGLLSSYRRLGVLAPPGDHPATACRPFDHDRNGFVVGEGAAVLVLEDWDHALNRGATPLAEWIDGAIASDSTGLTSVDDSGATLAHLISKLLTKNRLTPEDIQSTSVHGTATTMNDLTEARALQRVFQDQLSELICYAVKGAIGHLMGAAGAVESALSVLSLRDQLIPPTVNHLSADPECGLTLFQTAQPQEILHTLKISLGFGGHLAAGIFKRPTIR